jgi:hypothetical protein
VVGVLLGFVGEGLSLPVALGATVVVPEGSAVEVHWSVGEFDVGVAVQGEGLQLGIFVVDGAAEPDGPSDDDDVDAGLSVGTALPVGVEDVVLGVPEKLPVDSGDVGVGLGTRLLWDGVRLGLTGANVVGVGEFEGEFVVVIGPDGDVDGVLGAADPVEAGEADGFGELLCDPDGTAVVDA